MTEQFISVYTGQVADEQKRQNAFAAWTPAISNAVGRGRAKMISSANKLKANKKNLPVINDLFEGAVAVSNALPPANFKKSLCCC